MRATEIEVRLRDVDMAVRGLTAVLEAEPRVAEGQERMPLPVAVQASDAAHAREEATVHVFEVKRDSPRGSDATGRVLRESAEPMTLPQILDELERRGWAPEASKDPLTAVRASVNRLRSKDARYQLVRRGMFQYVPSMRAGPPAAVTDPDPEGRDDVG